MRKKYRIKIIDSYGVEQYVHRGKFTRKGKQKDNTYVPLYKDFGDEGRQVAEIEDRFSAEYLKSKLSKRQRQVIELRENRIPYKKIAEIMGIKSQTARVFKVRAKHKLGKIVNK